MPTMTGVKDPSIPRKGLTDEPASVPFDPPMFVYQIIVNTQNNVFKMAIFKSYF